MYTVIIDFKIVLLNEQQKESCPLTSRVSALRSKPASQTLEPIYISWIAVKTGSHLRDSNPGGLGVEAKRLHLSQAPGDATPWTLLSVVMTVVTTSSQETDCPLILPSCVCITNPSLLKIPLCFAVVFLPGSLKRWEVSG